MSVCALHGALKLEIHSPLSTPLEVAKIVRVSPRTPCLPLSFLVQRFSSERESLAVSDALSVLANPNRWVGSGSASALQD